MNSLLCRTVLSQNTKSCMVIKRANSFLVRSTGTLPLTNQKRTILSDSGLNRKDQLSYEEQELKNKEPFALKDCSRVECRLGIWSNGYKTALYYMLSVAAFFLGLGFWSVPLYRAFCESVGMGDSTQVRITSYALKLVQKLKIFKQFYSWDWKDMMRPRWKQWNRFTNIQSLFVSRLQQQLDCLGSLPLVKNLL